jgi:N-acetylglucosamine kinase-like BadF-type ATPase
MNVVAGMDVGGTKLAIRAETLAGDRVADATCGAADWAAVPAAAAASWLVTRLRKYLPDDSEIAALGVGAQGCDSLQIAANLERALRSLGLLATVVNDGGLLVPAAGLEHGIGVVVGTGSIGVAADASGGSLFAGGWGWVIGDEGGASAIVREATKAALSAHDAGRPDDGLLAALEHAFGVPSAERLARAVNDEPTVANWAPHAPVVFAAADQGSALADEVITAAAGQLTALVGKLIARGAVGGAVVAGGSVIINQPRLARAFRARLAGEHPALELRILGDEPVAGAVALARRLLTETA